MKSARSPEKRLSTFADTLLSARELLLSHDKRVEPLRYDREAFSHEEAKAVAIKVFREVGFVSRPRISENLIQASIEAAVGTATGFALMGWIGVPELVGVGTSVALGAVGPKLSKSVYERTGRLEKLAELGPGRIVDLPSQPGN